MNNNNNIIRNPHQLSRRRFLRGAGVVMALPWLESIPVWGAEPVTAGGTPAALPKRMAVLFMANGINPDHWSAEGAGADMKLGASLAPLEPYKTKINFIKGLFNKAATGVGIHPGMTGNLLSGMPLTKGAELHGGVSMDQVLSTRIGDQTVQPSMVIGCEQPVTGYHETNYSMAYSSHISWSSVTSPVPMEVYPSLAFDSLFDNKGNQRNQSVLDRVMDQAATLGRQVSSTDKAKLDEYLTSVREVEVRAQNMRAAKARADANAQGGSQPVVTMKRPDNGLPEDIREHMRLMCDILALGFQTDKTRIATLAALPRHLRACSTPSSTSSSPTTWPATRTPPTTSSASTSITPASLPTSSTSSPRCPKAKAPCSTIPASSSCPTCGPAAPTTAARCRCSPRAAWAARSRPAGCSTTPRPATKTASSAASTSRSWIAWA